MVDFARIEAIESAGWVDKDGLVVPEGWRTRADNWERLSLKMRTERSAAFAASLTAEPPKPKKKRAAGPAYTTRAAKDWGRRTMRWKLIDEERSAAYQKGGKWHRRTNDLMIGADLMFENPEGGLILVQAGGRNEWKEHWERFQERGGAEACRRRGCLFFYVEFDRGVDEPVGFEDWSPIAPGFVTLRNEEGPARPRINPAALD